MTALGSWSLAPGPHVLRPFGQDSLQLWCFAQPVLDAASLTPRHAFEPTACIQPCRLNSIEACHTYLEQVPALDSGFKGHMRTAIIIFYDWNSAAKVNGKEVQSLSMVLF